jgi:predicted RNA-binding Zn ribbon-like protein
MMESTAIPEMRLVGGNVAVDFVNTVDPDVAGGDHLPSYAAFEAWCRRVGLSAVPGRSLREVRTVRAQIDAVLRPLAAGRTASTAALGALQTRELEALGHAVLRPGGWEWGPGSALDRLVHTASELILTGPHERLRVCANCPWLFVDSSRNHSRRWCSMDACGTDVKIRRLSERRRAGG